ncbi:MAG: OmpA family protein [Phycisphaerae bacterium]|nr:OmpA family protein [Phycisphaerae bacterium]
MKGYRLYALVILAGMLLAAPVTNGEEKNTAAAQATPKGAEAKIDAFLQAMASKDSGDAEKLADSLRKMGRAVVTPLMKRLKIKDLKKDQRAGILFVLAGMGPDAKAAAPEFVKGLTDENERIRMFSTEALIRIGPAPGAAEALAKVLPTLAKTLTEQRDESRRIGDLLRRTLYRLDEQKKQTEKAKSRIYALEAKLVLQDRQIKIEKEHVALLKKARQDLQGRFEKLATQFGELLKSHPLPRLFVVPTDVHRALSAFESANPGLVEYKPSLGMVRLKSDLIFELGTTTLNPSATKAIAALVTILNAKGVATFNVYVAVHTDNIPISRPSTKRRHPDNWYLTAHRAISIRKVLEKSGLNPNRTCVMGFGEHQPLVPNRTSEGGRKRGQRLNRRVEIWVVPPGQSVGWSNRATRPEKKNSPTKATE